MTWLGRGHFSTSITAQFQRNILMNRNHPHLLSILLLVHVLLYSTQQSSASKCEGHNNGEVCSAFPLLAAQKFDPNFANHETLFRQAEDFRWKKQQNRRSLQEISSDSAGGSSSSEEFDGFVADKDSMTCTSDVHMKPFNTQVRGVCLGGWQVLEPWITPSLFYQFLGQDQNSSALDTYSFCEVLGPEEGNRQLRRHWDTWVTQEIIQELAQVEHVNSFRLPVGDWSFAPYGPYVGCTDGSLDYIDKVLDWAAMYNITVLLDIHTMKGSQNGFDNSGQARRVEWTSKFSKWPEGETQTFLHWPIREANWMGEFDRETMSYPVIDFDNISHSLTAIANLVERYKDHPAVLGLEPINEPWEFTPIDELKKFYFEGYLIVKRQAPLWKYVMHDSFRFDINIWGML